MPEIVQFAALDPPSWYAVRVRSKSEASTARFLQAKGVETFIPFQEIRKFYSDRVKIVNHALIPGYVFIRTGLPSVSDVLSAPGAIHIISADSTPLPIPSTEIEALRRITESGINASPCPYIKEGSRVRIRHGALVGVEGILVRIRNRFHFVVSIHLLQSSVLAIVDAESVELIA